MRYYYYGGKAGKGSLEEQQNSKRERVDKEQISHDKGYDKSMHHVSRDEDLVIDEDTVYEIDRQCMRKRNFPG